MNEQQKKNMKSALGKGIASLIQPSVLSSQPEIKSEVLNSASDLKENSIWLVDISKIKTNPHQPRKIFKEKDLQELADSIKENGILQPIIVMKNAEGFELIAGERRLRASKLAGMEKVPVIVKRVTDREKLVLALIENVQRSDLNCVEEALAYYQLMEDFQLTQEEVAKKVGKERSTVANFLRVLKLPRKVIEMLQREELSFGHAKILVAVKDDQKILKLAQLSVEKKYSVRELEIVAKKFEALAQVGKNETDNELVRKIKILQKELEGKTGFHMKIKAKSAQKGQILINYSDAEEFNKIFQFFTKRV